MQLKMYIQANFCTRKSFMTMNFEHCQYFNSCCDVTGNLVVKSAPIIFGLPVTSQLVNFLSHFERVPFQSVIKSKSHFQGKRHFAVKGEVSSKRKFHIVLRFEINDEQNNPQVKIFFRSREISISVFL